MPKEGRDPSRVKFNAVVWSRMVIYRPEADHLRWVLRRLSGSCVDLETALDALKFAFRTDFLTTVILLEL